MRHHGPIGTAGSPSRVETETGTSGVRSMSGLPSGVRPIQVLVVEDPASDTELTARLLHAPRLNLYIRRVENLVDFLDALKSQPDVIISDLAHPDFDGQRALSVSAERAAGVPFIMVSAIVTDEQTASLLALGAAAVIPKDSLDELPEAVRECLAGLPGSPLPTIASPDFRAGPFGQRDGYMRSLLDANLDALVAIGPDGKISDVNQAAEEMTGVSRSQLVGSDFAGYFTVPGDILQAYESTLSTGSVTGIPMTIRRIDGSLTEVLCNASVYRDPSGAVAGVLAAAHARTGGTEAEGSVIQIHGVASLGARAHQAGTAEEVFKDTTATMVGLISCVERCEVWRSDRDAQTLSLVASAPVSAVNDERARGARLQDGATVTVPGVHDPWGVIEVQTSGPGQLSGADFSVLREAANIVAAVVMRRDGEEALWYEARHDSLTGLPNRAMFLERLKAALDARPEQLVAVVMLDLENFKELNDRYGHERGDELLIEVGARLRAGLRLSDFVARLGGDEFAMVLTELADQAAVAPIIQRTLAALVAPVFLGDSSVVPGASIGWAIDIHTARTVTALLHGADVAMYAAKRAGKNAVVAFETSMDDVLIHQATLVDEIRQGIERHEFILYYQPQIDLRTGLISGAEALIRWLHPHRGLLPPSEFLDTLDRIGLMPQITAEVIFEACHWARSLLAEDARPFIISVNVTAADLEGQRLYQDVVRALNASGLDPKHLALEVTESGIHADLNAIATALEALQLLGVATTIDDFGTGYSSLSQLRRLPVTKLKIDCQFVDGLVTELDDAAMVASIISMAHSFGLDVIAEGVETPGQLEALGELGCEFAQGYLIGRPAPADAALPHQRAAELLQHRFLNPETLVPPDKWTCVIVDDLPNDRHLLNRALGRSGRFTVLGEAGDGKSAIDQVRTLHPDLLILDLDMPDMNGWTALRILHEEFVNTRVIVLTGYASETTSRAAKEAGALACIGKGPRDIVLEILAADQPAEQTMTP